MCPKCGSIHLKIKQLKGMERILLLWTGKRKYRCTNCFHIFRANDRRKVGREVPRGNPSAATSVLSPGAEERDLREDN
jgi:hypothetical protein